MQKWLRSIQGCHLPWTVIKYFALPITMSEAKVSKHREGQYGCGIADKWGLSLKARQPGNRGSLNIDQLENDRAWNRAYSSFGKSKNMISLVLLYCNRLKFCWEGSTLGALRGDEFWWIPNIGYPSGLLCYTWVSFLLKTASLFLLNCYLDLWYSVKCFRLKL